jgi:hypothetical protein
MQVEITDGDILVDAVLLGELLDIEPAGVSELMRAHAITGPGTSCGAQSSSSVSSLCRVHCTVRENSAIELARRNRLL